MLTACDRFGSCIEIKKILSLSFVIVRGNLAINNHYLSTLINIEACVDSWWPHSRSSLRLIHRINWNWIPLRQFIVSVSAVLLTRRHYVRSSSDEYCYMIRIVWWGAYWMILFRSWTSDLLSEQQVIIGFQPFGDSLL